MDDTGNQSTDDNDTKTITESKTTEPERDTPRASNGGRTTGVDDSDGRSDEAGID